MSLSSAFQYNFKLVTATDKKKQTQKLQMDRTIPFYSLMEVLVADTL